MDDSYGNNNNNDIRVRFSHASQRRQHRLTVPLAVQIANHAYTALDWSTAGIRLQPTADAGARFDVGETVQMLLSVPFQDFSVAIDLDAKVVRAGSTNGDTAFMFIDPPERATELLRYFADHLIRGEMAPIDGTIKRLDLPVTPPAPKPPPKETNGKVSKGHAVRSLMIGTGYLAAGVLVAIGLYYTLYTNFFLVTSDQALLYTPTVDVIVPEGGEVSAVYIAEGDQVNKGEPLLRMNSPRLDHLLSEAQREERSANNERLRLDASIKAEKDTLSTYSQIAANQVTTAKARLASAQSQQNLLEQQFVRVSQLSWQGMVSAQEIDRVRTARMRATETVTEAQADLRIAQSAYKAATMGIYYTSNRLESRMPELKSDLARAKDRIETAHSRVQELQKQVDQLVIRAPVAGHIQQIAVPPGLAVMAGTPVVSLLTDHDQLQIYAKISSDQLGRIAIGDNANVYVPALTRNLNARVVAVEPRLWSLPNQVRRLLGQPTDGGLVVLSFGAKLGGERTLLNPGLPVTVQLKNNSVRYAVHRVAGLFHFFDSNQAVASDTPRIEDSITPTSFAKTLSSAH